MKIRALVARTRLTEIQAIAIYEAEVFWIRDRARRELLARILGEERDHDERIAGYAAPSRISVISARLGGWVIGTILAALPWKWMCRFQAWAEDEAARIYEKAAGEANALSSEIAEKFRHASAQEREHADAFRSEAN